MKIKTSVFKRPTREKKVRGAAEASTSKPVKVKGGWFYRLRFTDQTGKPTSVERGPFAYKSSAADARDDMARHLERRTISEINAGDRMTFGELAAHCSERIYKPAVIVEGKKIEGVRSYATAQNYIKLLKRFFGKMLIADITRESLHDYRVWRLKIGSQRPEVLKKGKMVPVKLATINRELGLMRTVMKYALHRGWVVKDVFAGAKVIEVAAEHARERILSHSEEQRLLAACEGERVTTYERTRLGRTEKIDAKVSVDNPALKAIILLAIDGGLRKGEILKLEWDDFDFANDQVRVLGTNTKTERPRYAPLSARAKSELEALRPVHPERPFPFADFKRSWATAKRIACIEDLHFHDLRATAITRWQQYGLPIGIASKPAGHTNIATTSKYYTNPDADVIRGFADTINRMQALHSIPLGNDGDGVN